ncbi:hypothetical protein EV177_006720 [Coemansia sp. RSA 1804]|nr:hypothetical protein EV177_006720 [Coemansia sp. RSA 1804]
MKLRSLAALQLGSILWAAFASAESGYLAHGDGEGFKCAGVYGSSKGSDERQSMVEIEIPPVPPADISILVFSYPDSRWIGIPVKEGKKLPDDQVDMPDEYNNSGRGIKDSEDGSRAQRFMICSNETVTMGLCTEADSGRPLINDHDDKGTPRSFESIIYSDYIMLQRSGPGYTRLEYNEWSAKLNDSDTKDDSWKGKSRISMLDSATLQWLADGTLKIKYIVRRTGFYCVDAASKGDFTASVRWVNSHGLLPGSEYPKIFIYFSLMLAYAFIAVAWGFMSWKVWSEILPVQNQLFGLICLLAVDMGMNFGFWKHYNTTGSPSIVFSIFTLNYRYSLEELAGDEDEALEREQTTGAHDSFDNPRMGENLELEDMSASSIKDRRVPNTSDVQFVINEDDLEFTSDNSDIDDNDNPVGSSNYAGRHRRSSSSNPSTK